VIGAVHVAFFAGVIYCLPDLCASLARLAFSRSPEISVIGWVLTGFVFFTAVVCLYAVIDEWWHGPKRKRRQKDAREA